MTTREDWELCESNTFSGIHLWMLDVERDETARPIKDGATISYCKVCGSRPDWGHEQDVVAVLIQQRDALREAEHRRSTMRAINPRRRR